MTAIDDLLHGHDRNESVYPDVAFDPRPDFVFGDAEEGEYRSIQRNISSLSMFNSAHRRLEDFDLATDQAGDSLDPMRQAAFDDGMFFDPAGGLSSPSTCWTRNAHVLSQAETMGGRSPSVLQQYGQITPPDDSPPKEFPGSSLKSEAPLSAKSERARNAANQRHAKAKKAGKDSAREGKSSVAADHQGVEVEGKREKYREKNRVAAAKCRAKKKTHTESLEESARRITATNNRLRAEERELRDLFSSLRHDALAHDPTQGCTCSAIHMYNHNKAQEAARTAAIGLVGMGLPPPEMPSPSIGSEVSTNSPQFTSQPGSRAPSFSVSGQAYSSSQPPTQSVITQLGFLPTSTTSEMRRQSHTLDPIDSPDSAAHIPEYQPNFVGDDMDSR